MDSPRELVVEDIIQRMVDERGVEVLTLDWSILEQDEDKTDDE